MTYPVPERPPYEEAPSGHIPGAGPGGMQYGQATAAPEHEAVYPAGDPAITAVENGEDNGAWPLDPDGRTDFTNRRPRPRFRIGSETYEGKVEVPAGVMMKYSARAMKMAKELGEDDVEASILESLKMFRLLLKKESADRLVSHLYLIPEGATPEQEAEITDQADDDPDAIGLETFMGLLPWMMEQYGMAPTEPSGSVSDGSSISPDAGSGSTPS